MTLTDGSGNIVAQYSYDAWDNILSQTGSMASYNPYRYAGYRYNEVTGLYYLMARYYDAKIGRFITRDTFHGFENEPLSLNQYAYCKNNPVMYVDPDGHFTLSTLAYFIAKVIIQGSISYGAYLVKRYGWKNAYRKFSFNDCAWSVASAANLNLPAPIIALAGRIFFPSVVRIISSITLGSATYAAYWIAREIYR